MKADSKPPIWPPKTEEAKEVTGRQSFRENPVKIFKRYTCRSTSLSLSSAIAWDGLSPFGQALAQFMMVWQR